MLRGEREIEIASLENLSSLTEEDSEDLSPSPLASPSSEGEVRAHHRRVQPPPQPRLVRRRDLGRARSSAPRDQRKFRGVDAKMVNVRPIPEQNGKSRGGAARGAKW